MDTPNQAEVREFLMSRRARVTPAQVGLPAGPNRRVAGLRRAEVALLAGVSVEYYSRVERGTLHGVSDGVLDAISRALQLDDAEHAHLFDLASAANASPLRRKRRIRPQSIRPALQGVLDSYSGGPAFVRNSRLDILASNHLGRAMYWDMFTQPARPVNLARYAFLDREHADRFYPNWDLAADQSVAILRTEAGRDPYDRDLQDLIGELSTRSPEFREKWGAHDVRIHGTGTKHFHHHVVGDLHLNFEGLELMADPGLSLLLYSAEPNTPTADALIMLASWAATEDALQTLPETTRVD